MCVCLKSPADARECLGACTNSTDRSAAASVVNSICGIVPYNIELTASSECCGESFIDVSNDF